MIVENFIKVLIETHRSDIESFKKFTVEKKFSDRKWLELAYCILAGTQMKNSLVYEIFQKLLSNNSEDLKIRSLSDPYTGAFERLKEALKSYGYRFYKTKAKAIRYQRLAND